MCPGMAQPGRAPGKSPGTSPGDPWSDTRPSNCSKPPPPAYDTSPYPTQKAVSRSRLSQEGIEPPGEPGGQGLADHKGFYVCGDNSW